MKRPREATDPSPAPVVKRQQVPPISRGVSPTYYVTDMHTGRIMCYSGPGAYYRARSRMVAGLYFRPDMPDIIFRGGRLATQNGKGGLVTQVSPLRDFPGGLGLSAESFAWCCRCSRPGCSAEVFSPSARGVRRRPEHLRLARARHQSARPRGELRREPPFYCLYVRCDRCAGRVAGCAGVH